MPTLLIVLAVAAVAVAVFGLPVSGLGFFPPRKASTVVRIRAGRMVMQRGQLRSQVRDDVQDVLAGAGVKTGFIAITGGSQVCFSRNIPRALHQRLRNVLLN